jgi:hypothetical protein
VLLGPVRIEGSDEEQLPERPDFVEEAWACRAGFVGGWRGD